MSIEEQYSAQCWNLQDRYFGLKSKFDKLVAAKENSALLAQEEAQYQHLIECSRPLMKAMISSLFHSETSAFIRQVDNRINLQIG